MKNFKKVFSIILVLLCVALTACSKSGSNSTFHSPSDVTVTFIKNSLTIAVGETVELELTEYYPTLYYGDDTDIVTTTNSATGEKYKISVTGKAKGTTTIYAHGISLYRFTDSCTITVTGGSGKKVDDIKKAFGDANYTHGSGFSNPDSTATFSFYQSNVNNGSMNNYIDFIIFADDDSALQWQDYYSKFSDNWKIDGHILYYGTEYAIALYESINPDDSDGGN